MKAFILMAESATQHPDGTFSVLRAGIDRVWSEKAPVNFAGVLIFRFSGEASESGEHRFVLTCIDADGKRVTDDLKGKFNIGDQGGSGLTILGFHFQFPAFGNYEFGVVIDGQKHENWPFKILPKEKT